MACTIWTPLFMLISTWKPLQWRLPMAIGLYIFLTDFFFLGLGKLARMLILNDIFLFTGLNLRHWPSFIDRMAPFDGHRAAASAACFLKCPTCGMTGPAAHLEAYSQQILSPKINIPGCFLFLKGKQKPLLSRGKGEHCLDHHPGGIRSSQFPLEIPRLCWLRPPIRWGLRSQPSFLLQHAAPSHVPKERQVVQGDLSKDNLFR